LSRLYIALRIRCRHLCGKREDQNITRIKNRPELNTSRI